MAIKKYHIILFNYNDNFQLYSVEDTQSANNIDNYNIIKEDIIDTSAILSHNLDTLFEVDTELF